EDCPGGAVGRSGGEVFRIAAQLPLQGLACNLQREHGRKTPGPENQALQFVPPERVPVADIAGCDKDSRWYLVLLEQRLHARQVVCIAVVEGEGDCPLRSSFSLYCRYELAEPHRCV